MATDAIITLKDAAVGYGGEPVLTGLNFSVRRGEIFVVAGGSGCGKSTIMRTLITLLPPMGGQVMLDGVDLARATGDEINALRRRIGVMYQSGALFGGLTLLENVRLPLEEFTSLSAPAQTAVARAKLAVVGLSADAEKLPSEVSGGMQKRAAVARALALDAPIAFLDEPTAGLDPVTSAEFDELILSLNSLLGTTFVVVTHELPSIERIATRMVICDRRRKTAVAIGAPRELREQCTDPEVQAFLNRRSMSGAGQS